MGFFIKYYNGWLRNGFFYWLLEKQGLSAFPEPWRTPVGFWFLHIGLLISMVVIIIAVALGWFK